ncbi:MAG: hypothetical protein JRJ04_18765, partial [Deltaproteobacteria bacterium]|nr:hypothetical protein [Deltaproteobacteria bacterium]
MKKALPSKIIDSIIAVLSGDDRILFAFLYGSSFEYEKGSDIDIAVYTTSEEDFHVLSSDLKIALHKKTGLPPDNFDIQVLNGIVEHGNVFDLLYLK